jgi:AcrR family transcriptional regulator
MPEGVDGRLSRTMRSRLAICNACLDLVQEGVLRPSADQIAERAGLSRRSIFYHFSDLALLYDAVVEVGMQRCAPLLKEIPREAPVADRVAMLSDVRSKFFEGTAPFARALTAQSLVGPASEQARRVALDALALQKRDVERLFESELEGLSSPQRSEIIEAISAATTAPMWEYLRRSRGLSMPRARAVMKRTLTALLRDAGVEIP